MREYISSNTTDIYNVWEDEFEAKEMELLSLSQLQVPNKKRILVGSINRETMACAFHIYDWILTSDCWKVVKREC